MPQLTVCSRLQTRSLRQRLDRHADALEDAGASVAIHESAAGERAIFTCALDDPTDRHAADGLAELLRSCVAQAIAETVVEEIVPEMIVERLRTLRPQYDGPDIDAALAYAERSVERCTGSEAVALVAASALDCLWERDHFDVEGFVRFRLHEYRRKLDECLRDAVRRYEFSREQQEFIKLLKYLIDHQEASVDELHIYPGREDSFEMRDQYGSAVDSEYLEAYVWDLAREGCVDREDLLISALVSLAPQKVHWHIDRSAWRSPMLEKVLGGRLVYCTGCEHCTQSRN